MLDLPLRVAVPLGLASKAASEATGLWIYSLGGDSNATALDGDGRGLAVLLAQPVLSNALGAMSIVPILAMGAAAADGGGQGAAFGVVSAADSAGSLAAGSLSIALIDAFGIGNPPRGSWRYLPALIGVCAAAKLLAAPIVLLLLRLRRWRCATPEVEGSEPEGPRAWLAPLATSDQPRV